MQQGKPTKGKCSKEKHRKEKHTKENCSKEKHRKEKHTLEEKRSKENCTKEKCIQQFRNTVILAMLNRLLTNQFKADDIMVLNISGLHGWNRICEVHEANDAGRNHPIQVLGHFVKL